MDNMEEGEVSRPQVAVEKSVGQDHPESEAGDKIAKEAESISEAQCEWDNASNETEKIIDAIGHPIDENIKETVTSLNVFDINTSGSCEGHIDSGAGTPWVGFSSSNEPAEKFTGETIIIERVAKENGISVDSLKKEEAYEDLYWQTENEFEKNGETKEAIAWREENEKLRVVIEDVVVDFYQDRDVSDEVRLRFEDIGAFGEFRIISGTHDDYERDYEKMTEAEKEDLGKRLEEYRSEMKSFSSFLKDKFFSEGRGYINSKRDRAQEMVDQKKYR